MSIGLSWSELPILNGKAAAGGISSIGSSSPTVTAIKATMAAAAAQAQAQAAPVFVDLRSRTSHYPSASSSSLSKVNLPQVHGFHPPPPHRHPFCPWPPRHTSHHPDQLPLHQPPPSLLPPSLYRHRHPHLSPPPPTPPGVEATDALPSMDLYLAFFHATSRLHRPFHHLLSQLDPPSLSSLGPLSPLSSMTYPPSPWPSTSLWVHQPHSTSTASGEFPAHPLPSLS